MNDYQVWDDIEVICELLNITAADFAARIGVTPDTVSRWKNEKTAISRDNLHAIYDFAFSERIRLNQIKAQLFREECTGKNRTILFHGAKTFIDGEISVSQSRVTNDFGKGFYCGESLEQSAMFVSGYPESSLYIAEFDSSGLVGTRFFVNREWMLIIAFFRGRLAKYADHPLIMSILKRIEGMDYIIAPIADNRMFEIIDSFIEGEITDIQCQHCLSATNLGNQFVFKTEKAVKQLEIKRHCFLCNKEKQFFLQSKQEESKLGNDKVKIARKQYRGQGEYIEDILQ